MYIYIYMYIHTYIYIYTHKNHKHVLREVELFERMTVWDKSNSQENTLSTSNGIATVRLINLAKAPGP